MSKFAAGSSSIPGTGWATNNRAVFQLGRDKTLAVPMEVHAMARQKLVKKLRSGGSDGSGQGITDGLVLLQGGQEQTQYDSDTELVFRQDSWFNYLFGVKEAGVYGAISVATGKTTLFIPRLADEYRIWCGDIHPPSAFQVSYAVDEVLYVEQLSDWVQQQLQQQQQSQLLVMNGVNSDSGISAVAANFDGMEALTSAGKVSNSGLLYNTLALCRVTKCAQEVEVMRYVANVASNAHAAVMRFVGCGDDSATHCKPQFEFELEAKFQYEIYRHGGCRKCAYTSICACGPNSAVLHYGHAGAPNARELLPTDMALLDMGAEYHGYVSDLTCSYPVSGKFSADQRSVYEGVLNAQRAVLQHMLPGVQWTDCHRIAELAVLTNLIAMGILHNGTAEEMQQQHVGAVFMPHGLGHLIGCDTHDVGGYIPGTPSRLPLPGVGKLRTSRVLEVDMVLTNEPGCYFIDALLDAALTNPAQCKYFNSAVLQRFRGFGGVRLEDVVIVRDAAAGGAESLSTCPRTVEEVEAVMAGGVWPPAVDRAPELKRRWTKLAPGGFGMENIDIPIGE